MRKKPAKERANIEIIYSVGSSLDGFIATSDGGVDWLSRFQGAAEEHGVADLESSVDAVGSWQRPFTARALFPVT